MLVQGLRLVRGGRALISCGTMSMEDDSRWESRTGILGLSRLCDGTVDAL